MINPVSQPDRFQPGPRPVERIRRAGELRRNGDILQRAHRRDQMKILKDDPHAVTAEQRERILVQPGQFRAVDLDRAGGRLLQPGDHHHHGGLARPGWADDADRFARADVQIDPLQDIDRSGRPVQRQTDVLQ